MRRLLVLAVLSPILAGQSVNKTLTSSANAGDSVFVDEYGVHFRLPIGAELYVESAVIRSESIRDCFLEIKRKEVFYAITKVHSANPDGEQFHVGVVLKGPTVNKSGTVVGGDELWISCNGSVSNSASSAVVKAVETLQ